MVDELRDLPEGAMVLARRNAPLLTQALRLLRQGVRVRLEGRDVIAPVVSALKAVERDFGLDWRGCAPALAAYFHKAEGDEALREALLLIAHLIDSGARSLEEVTDRLTRRTENAQVTLCTMHKSKGLEARHVYVLLPEKPEEEDAQAKNVNFVAATRAQVTLKFVGKKEALERWLAA